MVDIPSVWDRINPTPPEATSTVATEESAEDRKAHSKHAWKIVRRLDALALIFWTYATAKVFIADWDHTLIHRLSPQHEWLLNFRILVFILAIFVLFRAAKGKLAILWIAYIAVWPLALIAWRIPWALYKRSQWTGIVGFLHVLTGSIRGFKSFLIGVGLLSLYFLFALIPSKAAAIAAPCTATVLLLWLLTTSVRAGFAPSRFMKTQAKMVTWLKPTTLIPTHTRLLPTIKAGKELTMSESDQFLQNVTSALLVNRAAYFWAYRINEYRKSSALILFSALSTAWLFLGTVLCYALMNKGLFEAHQASFQIQGKPSFIKFAYYSAIGMYAGDTSLIQPVSDAAIAVKFSQVIVGGLVVIGLVTTLYFSHRFTRDEQSAQEAVDQIRTATQTLEAEFADSFEATPSAAIDHLQRLGHSLSGILVYLTQAVPPGWIPANEGVQQEPNSAPQPAAGIDGATEQQPSAAAHTEPTDGGQGPKESTKHPSND